jgi:hypothetical protein
MHPTRPASAPEIMYQMSMDDVMDAHRALDAYDEARATPPPAPEVR